MSLFHHHHAKGPELTAISVSAPVISSITFDKSLYTPGQTITATVNYAAGVSSNAQTFTGVALDSNTGQQGSLTVTFSTGSNDTTTVTVSDSGNRTWTKTSDNGSVAVFTAVA